MSWDVVICKFKGKEPPKLEELVDEDCLPLGSATQVRESISAALPAVNWSDPMWGVLEGAGFSIEFNIGDEDPVENLMLHVRGGGDVISAIMSFCAPLGWLVLDCTTGEYLDPANPSKEGWDSFQKYRDKVLREIEDEEER